jgi:uncharacterized LabA/DUF88 family protein
MQNYAILIDGGFAKRKLGNAKLPATSLNFKKLVDALQLLSPLSEMRLHRVYYYDSMPLESSHEKPLEGGLAEFGKSKIVGNSKSLFEELAKQPYTALRLGELSFNGWKLKSKRLAKAKGGSLEISHEDLQPQITQKGVDMRIGMDIAALTLKKQVEVIVLVSGDSDFIPAMKFARREGVNVFLATLGHRVKPIMLEHSDLALELDEFSFAKQEDFGLQ